VTSFLTLARGTPVVDRFGSPVGSVHRVLFLEGQGFDGLVVDTERGTRFVDAPEVRRISGGAVTLGITDSDVLDPGADAERRYGMPVARHGRTLVTEADRDDVIEALKRAFVDDVFSTDELAERVAAVHTANTLDELDRILG
jgi:hypothetical protein